MKLDDVRAEGLTLAPWHLNVDEHDFSGSGEAPARWRGLRARLLGLGRDAG
jgi:hypothetical protein